jgi:membrane protease YdiL (CAAX protease family)
MAALATRGLALPIGLHAAYNFGHWLIGEKGQPGLWSPVIEEGFKTHVECAELISYLIVFGSGTLALCWWRHRMKTTRIECPNGLL